MTHEKRRWLLHEAVEQLEPEAHSAAVRAHLQRLHRLDLPLIRIYVDLEHLVADGHLMRHTKALEAGHGATFHWETTGKVLVQPDRPVPKASAAAATLGRRRKPPVLRAVTPATAVVREVA